MAVKETHMDETEGSLDAASAEIPEKESEPERSPGLPHAEAIEFSRISDPYGCFSNFSRHPITVDGITWLTSEHYFQAQKFAGSDPDWVTEIQHQVSPMAAAMKGRSRAHPIRADWAEVRDDVMRRAVLTKALEHADVRETLESTGDRVIVEKRAKDSYWGSGRSGGGKNMLGRIWMEARDVLRHEAAGDAQAVESYLKALAR